MSETKAGDKYVVGFAFSPLAESVVLIRKTHPNWQAGKLNGVGGRIEDGESALDAMRREFAEETGIYHLDWSQFCVLGDARSWQIHFFSASPKDIWSAQSTTDEEVEICSVTELPNYVIPNLRWLIPMALSMKHESISGFDIREVSACTQVK
jgi:8-oxo-dGTP diphosphatase